MFTIVSENYGPGAAEIDVDTEAASSGLTPPDAAAVNYTSPISCAAVSNGPAPPPRIGGNDGSACEHMGSYAVGTTFTDTLVVQIASTSTGYASDTACVWDPGGYWDPNPGNDCATAKVIVDSPTPANADLEIVSATANVTHAKVGDNVTFTIVAKNNGPDPATLWVDTMQPIQGFTSGAYLTCASQQGLFSRGASWCEHDMAQPGQFVTDTVVSEVAPTTDGSVSDTACVLTSGINDPSPSNDCATATITLDSPCPGTMPGATQTLGNVLYNLAGEDTFTKLAPMNSFASTDRSQIVYTGDHGMGWSEYPDGWSSTWSGGAEGYHPLTTQWVHGGVLDFNLQENGGHPVGASISPWPGGTQYQTYGAWSFCERVPPYG
ncbi:MAG: hypothetical protein ACRDPA_15385, partial [Solirubrobacteraceae bacterium]